MSCEKTNVPQKKDEVRFQRVVVLSTVTQTFPFSSKNN